MHRKVTGYCFLGARQANFMHPKTWNMYVETSFWPCLQRGGTEIVMFKKSIISAFFLSAVLFTVTSFAYETRDFIKVGLSFGSEAKTSFTVTVHDTATVGHTYEYNYYPEMTVGASDFIIEKGGGAYLRTTNTYATLEEAAKKARELRALGVYAYGGYVDGNNYLMFGLYGSLEEARLSASDLEFTALSLTPVSLDTKAVMVTSDNLNLVFRHDSEIFAVGSSSGSAVSVDGSKYYGYILADRIHSSNIAVVNLVLTDDYVACVVGSEMYPTWHIEALKAQAVIARTYAITSSSYRSYGIDVTDDTRSQAYYGISRETDSTRRAAQETSGIVLLYNGNPAQTFFCASSGGKTADVYSAWGGGEGLDYLQSVDDPYEDSENVAVWSVTYTTDEIALKLANAGVDIGRITDVVVIDRGERDERVRKLRFDGTNGSHTVTFEKCRTILGLKSQYYYIRDDEQNKSAAAAVLTGGGSTQISLGASKALSRYGVSTLDGGANVLGSGGSVYIKPAESTQKDSFTFDGRGNGHGVGLSQYGAKGMAESGFGYEEILQHYYVGTTLSK